MLLELGRGVRGTIAHTQPRRLAARTVAERIAEELGVELGSAVGFAVRFSDRSRDDTLIRLVTDGLLLAEIQHDPLLRRYDTIVVDEAHERSLNVDFLLGYLKRILPKRPDLKVVITSATIDPDRFSRHFGDAPVVEVSGRTYPVEVRYRPPADDTDPVDAIGDAVEELLTEGDGDVLVFLSGEREIRDTAESLTGRLGAGVEVLPLFARLATADQQRIFKPHRGRRVVLATNVAETSLTVPGIKYVVDPGTARISRYSARLKVQRLPIERISQASADQRKGRCGRTSDGICIRLYDEEEFAGRPRYTDPEILRTNLASVILQLATLGLGDVEELPFLDPPDRRQIRDGVLLLQELGALDADGALTEVGRRLARLPVDPRMGRMVLEADRLSCAEEVVVIAAALSIQDPRERPAERRAAADQQHARFADEHSDFLSHLNLWRHLEDRQRELSGNQFRKRCHEEFLHYMRIREWQDLVGQLRRAARDAGVTFNQTPAEPDQIHIALLSGLLSHIGLRDAGRREYQGARGARFAIFPGSKLAKKGPTWVMVSELVETSRLFGRTAARIQPQWIEPLAEHLVKRTHSEPRWDRRRGAVVATERVTLYGLPIVTGRAVAYGGIDPKASRELFLRRALVERDWETRHHFFAANGRLLDEVEELQHRARRADLLADDQALYEFFDARVPEKVVSGAHFDRWWRDARKREPDLLTYTRELLLPEGAGEEEGRPQTWRQDGVELPLSYRFEPGTQHDGVTADVPLTALGSLRSEEFDWLVPAFRHELVVALLRSLPKELRRPLVPVPDTATSILEGLEPGGEPLLDALGREIERRRGVRIPRDAWDTSKLPPHLRMRFRVQDEGGAVVAEGQDLDALRAKVRPRLQAELTAATEGLERHGLREWPGGALPRDVELPGSGGAVRAYPALVDEGDAVGVQVFDTPADQAAAMQAGTRRLLLLTTPSPAKWVRDQLGGTAQLALAAAPHGSLAAVIDDAMTAAADALMAQAGGPAWDEAGFARLRGHVAGNLAETTAVLVGQVVQILGVSREVQRRLDELTAAPLQPVRDDVERQLQRLVCPGFITASGARRMPDVLRYVRGAARRLERIADTLATDRDRMQAVHELEQAYERRLDAWPQGRPLSDALCEVPWLLEELRISHFAQGLGVRRGDGPVSSKRIRRLIDDA